MKYFIRKLVLSAEFIVLALMFVDFFSLKFKSATFFLLGSGAFSSTIYIAVTTFYVAAMIHLFFPFADKKNIMKQFRFKRELYVTNIISVFYYFVFSLLFAAAANFNQLQFLADIVPNYPFYLSIGMAFLLLSTGVNVIILNIMLRDHS